MWLHELGGSGEWNIERHGGKFVRALDASGNFRDVFGIWYVDDGAGSGASVGEKFGGKWTVGRSGEDGDGDTWTPEEELS